MKEAESVCVCVRERERERDNSRETVVPFLNVRLRGAVETPPRLKN